MHAICNYKAVAGCSRECVERSLSKKIRKVGVNCFNFEKADDDDDLLD